MISLTFDDGWKNQYTRALPILERLNLKGTFYVITQMPEYMLEEGEGRMIIDEWVDLNQKGHEVGAHSRTHPHLQFCMPNKLKREILGSKNDLLKIGIEAKTFCYPYGRRNFIVDSIVRSSGFEAARLAEGNYNNKKTSKFNLNAFCLRDFTTFEEVIKMIDYSKMNNLWLILVFHQIEPNPTSWGTSPELFEKICEYINNKKYQVVTVEDGIKTFLQ